MAPTLSAIDRLRHDNLSHLPFKSASPTTGTSGQSSSSAADRQPAQTRSQATARAPKTNEAIQAIEPLPTRRGAEMGRKTSGKWLSEWHSDLSRFLFLYLDLSRFLSPGMTSFATCIASIPASDAAAKF